MQHASRRMLAVAALSAGLAANSTARAASCADTLLSNKELARFAALVQAAGLSPQLATGTVTVFAPTNAALGRISGLTQMLAPQSSNGQADYPKLQTLVRAHLVAGLHSENSMHGKVALTTLAGTGLAIDGTGRRSIALSTSSANNVNLSGMKIMSDVHVAGPALECDNGLIYPVDAALVQ